MKLVVLGLSLSSSWGNGHATTYRALLSAFARRGHMIEFLERDLPWYRDNRDCSKPDFCELRYYASISDLRVFESAIRDADAVVVGSYVPDGVKIGHYVQQVSRGLKVFYDIDTPITLARLSRGDQEYISPELIPGYDLYLSFTGGPTLVRLEREFGSPCARALYCSVDTDLYRPLDVPKRWDLTYLGTYSPDRQDTLERLLLDVARRNPDKRFCVAGPQYPPELNWPETVERIEHLPPDEHPAFYSASRYTLNVTRGDMIEAGWSPSVRLFEAGACGAAIISDRWEGIETILRHPDEIVLADTSEDVMHALARQSDPIGAAARRRVLEEHSADIRAAQLEHYLDCAGSRPTASRSENLDYAK